MGTKKFLRYGILAGAAFVMWKRRATVANTIVAPITNVNGWTVGGSGAGLNSGIYNPQFNPGGQTNYSASFMGVGPATGWSNS